ncbi:hypothetical protein K474DRAFT_1731580 [Panus rudis PR-1116 ss-1]|nr:hypothetical protein K474DRAFT_1731580 [Panus rudis PR-1116 ss-1]
MKPVHCRHAHMHTRDLPGINTTTATDLNDTFTIQPPLQVAATAEEDEELLGPEGISEEDIDRYFKEMNAKEREAEGEGSLPIDPALEDEAAEVNEVYSFDELEKVDKGIVPTSFEESVRVVDPNAQGDVPWSVEQLLLSQGINPDV